MGWNAGLRGRGWWIEPRPRVLLGASFWPPRLWLQGPSLWTLTVLSSTWGRCCRLFPLLFRLRPLGSSLSLSIIGTEPCGSWITDSSALGSSLPELENSPGAAGSHSEKGHSLQASNLDCAFECPGESPSHAGADAGGVRFPTFNELPGDGNAAGPREHTSTSA